jgi:KDO2-lipid IV(A) lauroyltransferase
MVDYFVFHLHQVTCSNSFKKPKPRHFLYAIRNESDGFDMFIEPIDPAIYEGSDAHGTLVITPLKI